MDNNKLMNLRFRALNKDKKLIFEYFYNVSNFSVSYNEEGEYYNIYIYYQDTKITSFRVNNLIDVKIC